MLIGGTDLNDVMDSTYYFSHEIEQWTEGPKLIQARQGHSAGLITDKVTKETFAIVVGGQNHVSTDVLDTTEILKEGVWVSGENLHLINNLFQSYCRIASSSLSQLVAHFQVFRRPMKGKFDGYVL